MNRRDFLVKASAASMAYSALPLLPALQSEKRYRTALIGSGWGHQYPPLRDAGWCFQGSSPL